MTNPYDIQSIIWVQIRVSCSVKCLLYTLRWHRRLFQLWVITSLALTSWLWNFGKVYSYHSAIMWFDAIWCYGKKLELITGTHFLNIKSYPVLVQNKCQMYLNSDLKVLLTFCRLDTLWHQETEFQGAAFPMFPKSWYQANLTKRIRWPVSATGTFAFNSVSVGKPYKHS